MICEYTQYSKHEQAHMFSTLQIRQGKTTPPNHITLDLPHWTFHKVSPGALRNIGAFRNSTDNALDLKWSQKQINQGASPQSRALRPEQLHWPGTR